MTIHRRKAYGIFLLLLVGCLTSWGCMHAASKNGAKAAGTPSFFETRGKVSPAYIRDTIKLLQDQYVEETDVVAMLKGAKAGLQAYLKELDIKDDKVDAFDPTGEESIQIFVSLLTDVQAHYHPKVVEESLVYSALRGLMGALKDPYSVALDPKEYRQLTEQMSGGNFGGIGIYIERDRTQDDQLTVVEPIEDSPATRAGLQPGDLIVKINDESTKGMDLEIAANRIRGPVGTNVRLLIKHPDQEPHEVKMLRELIHVKSATYRSLPDHIGYVKLRFFGQETDEEFDQALSQSEKDQDRALVIDLRNNGGGYIKAAIDVCSKFLPRGALVVSVVNYRKNSVEPDKSYGANRPHLPVVVLVNSFSASASEITAGALQDTGMGVLLGMKTFGKGSVQTIHDLPDGGALKFTIAHYLTPKGRNINKKGIQPDIEVKMSPDLVGDPGDKQLDAAVTYLKKKLEI